jgi:hypothetical protein
MSDSAIVEDGLDGISTAGPFAGMTGAQIGALTAVEIHELEAKFIAAQTPGWHARHAAQKLLDRLLAEAPTGRTDIISTPSEIARRIAAFELGSAFIAIDASFDGLLPDGESYTFVYANLRKLIERAYELGRFRGFDGAKARAQKTEKARARDHMIFIAVKRYLLANPQVPRRASEKGAAVIQPAIEEILGFAVSLNKLVDALRKFRKECVGSANLV